MTFLDLCAGIGGFTLGLEWAGMNCKGQVEIDDYCTGVLKRHWPHVPKWRDVRECAANPDCLPTVDLIAGGYPCQPFSLAGQRRGTSDDRHLWPEIFTLVRHKQPAWCLFENVVGHVTLGLKQVLSDLESEGYETEGFVIPACAADAPHRRDRFWIIAHAAGKRINGSGRRKLRQWPWGNPETGREGLRQANGTEGTNLTGAVCEAVSNSHGTGCEKQYLASITDKQRFHTGLPSSSDVPHSQHNGNVRRDGQLSATTQAGGNGNHYGGRETPHEPRQRWSAEPGVGRVAYGIPHRVDRIRALGNAVVPQVVYVIGRAIMTGEAQALMRVGRNWL